MYFITNLKTVKTNLSILFHKIVAMKGAKEEVLYIKF